MSKLHIPSHKAKNGDEYIRSKNDGYVPKTEKCRLEKTRRIMIYNMPADELFDKVTKPILKELNGE